MVRNERRESTVNYWVFVFNSLRNVEVAPTKAFQEFHKIVSALQDLLVCNTPGVEFETFTQAVPGYQTHMIRFEWSGASHQHPAENWKSIKLPWLLLKESSTPLTTECVYRHGIGQDIETGFQTWLSSNRQFLWDPYD